MDLKSGVHVRKLTQRKGELQVLVIQREELGEIKVS